MDKTYDSARAVDTMKKLIAMITSAAEAYYQYDNPIMSDKEYDSMCDALEDLERTSGIVLSNSPIHKVQGSLSDHLAKVPHTVPMLSAQKTKQIPKLEQFQKGQILCASWKEDGLSIIARYKNGKFVQALTRGDGAVGEDVTLTAKTISNLPAEIPYTDDLEVRGECLISWATHKMLQKQAESKGEQIGHPRNVAGGALRQSDVQKAADTYLEFKVFDCITPLPDVKTKMDQFIYLQTLGFDVVEWMPVPVPSTIPAVLERMNPEHYPYPVDGIIFEINDLSAGKALGSTEHHPRNMMAYKWQDDTVATTFRGVDLRVTRTGMVSLTAVFDSVVIDNTVVSRATLHNVAYFKKLQLGAGDTITVYKANKIIPEVDDNLTRSGTYPTPTHCPCCGAELVTDGVVLRCPNIDCSAKQVSRFTHYASKNAMDMVGLGERQIESLVSAGLLTSYADFYDLKNHKQEILDLDGFSEKAFKIMVDSIERSRCTSMDRFLIALGILYVGPALAKRIHKYFSGDYYKFVEYVKKYPVSPHFSGTGPALDDALKEWATDPVKQKMANDAAQFLTFREPLSTETMFTGKRIAITGATQYKRKDLIGKLERGGGIYTDVVSARTDYLVVGKNAGKKMNQAKNLGVVVMEELDFLKHLEGDTQCTNA